MTLERLLTDARSPDWAVRADAAAELARLDDPEARRIALALLSDDEDTAVAQAATHAALERADAAGADLVFEALAIADVEIGEHILSFLFEDDLLERSRVVEHARARAAEGGTDRSRGASELLAFLHVDPMPVDE